MEDNKTESETIVTSRSGRKIRMNAAARAVVRSNSHCGGVESPVESPVVTRCREQEKSKGNRCNGGGCLLFSDSFVAVFMES